MNAARSKTAQAARNRVALQRLVRGRRIHIHTSPPRALEEKHGYTKHGHGKHYICVGAGFDTSKTIDASWDRRCSAAKWAHHAGVKGMTHWYQI